ncbi:MAG: YhcH/YjgK/YiaL family protein [Bacteroidetes bacterium]|nr:YhcH/YjgK/YiaL family protein [Bacteroidota bacterium]
MIVDAITNTASFAHLPWFERIHQFLASTDLDALEPGRVEIDGDRLFAIVADDHARDARPLLEAHRRYIDLQLAVHGAFDVLWRPLSSCTTVDQPYDAETDLIFMADTAQTRLHLSAGMAAVFFPDDAHAPQPPANVVRKIVFKIHV